MKAERMYTTISLAIIVGLFYLFYKILSPFLSTIAWAMVLSITFYPLYMIFLKYVKRQWIASLLTLLIILIIIIGPFTYIISSLVTEITDILSKIEDKGFNAIWKIQEQPQVARLLEELKTFGNFDLKESAVNAVKSVGTYIDISGIFKNVIDLVVNFVLMCLTIFYFFKDGDKLIEYLKKLLPFSSAQKRKLEERVKEMVVAAIFGGLAVGVAQGFLGGIAFLLFGLPSPVFWGTTMALFSLVPIFGTFIIWGPASLFLIFSGSVAKGIGLLLYGVLIISMVDNILKPVIIGSRTKLHTLLIFFSVIGGIKFLGLLGVILGPLITALSLSLLEIYTVEETT